MSLTASPVEIQRMADRIAYLEEQVAYYESELGLSDDIELENRLRSIYTLMPTDAKVLATLYTARPGRTLTREHLDDIISTFSCRQHETKVVEVYICRIRKILDYESVDNVWGRGYKLSPIGRKKVGAALEAAYA
jgi:DNA-binding winged helix-turn-helix (wHTH) protein